MYNETRVTYFSHKTSCSPWGYRILIRIKTIWRGKFLCSWKTLSRHDRYHQRWQPVPAIRGYEIHTYIVAKWFSTVQLSILLLNNLKLIYSPLSSVVRNLKEHYVKCISTYHEAITSLVPFNLTESREKLRQLHNRNLRVRTPSNCLNSNFHFWRKY